MKNDMLNDIINNPLLVIIYPIMLIIWAPIFIGYIALIQFQKWMEEKPVVKYMKERYCLEQYSMLLEEE